MTARDDDTRRAVAPRLTTTPANPDARLGTENTPTQIRNHN